MKDKLDCYLDILNDCTSVTDDNLKQILEDKDLKETLRIVRKTTDALTETPEPDIDQEWAQFETRNFHNKHYGYVYVLSRFLSRNAAALIICAVASLAVVAASIGVNYSFNENSKRQGAQVETTESYIADNCIAMDSITEPCEQMVSPETTIFKNQSFDSILSIIAEAYGASLNFKTDNTKDLRLYFQWDQSLPLEVIVAQLNNFEQVNIKLNNNIITIE